MPQLPRELVKARATRLREVAADRRERWLKKLVGTTQRVLIENGGRGHTDNFAPVALDNASRGDAGLARFTGRDSDRLTAVWA